MNETIRKIAEREKMSQLFIDFMEKRFPGELHESYILEWVGRFKSGDPTPWMDTISRRVYEGLK